MTESLHEKVAYSLAASRMVGEVMTYGEILQAIKRTTPDETILLANVEKSLAAVNATRIATGREPYSLDEWFDFSKRVYLMNIVGNTD